MLDFNRKNILNRLCHKSNKLIHYISQNELDQIDFNDFLKLNQNDSNRIDDNLVNPDIRIIDIDCLDSDISTLIYKINVELANISNLEKLPVKPTVYQKKTPGIGSILCLGLKIAGHTMKSENMFSVELINESLKYIIILRNIRINFEQNKRCFSNSIYQIEKQEFQYDTHGTNNNILNKISIYLMKIIKIAPWPFNWGFFIFLICLVINVFNIYFEYVASTILLIFKCKSVLFENNFFVSPVAWFKYWLLLKSFLLIIVLVLIFLYIVDASNKVKLKSFNAHKCQKKYISYFDLKLELFEKCYDRNICFVIVSG